MNSVGRLIRWVACWGWASCSLSRGWVIRRSGNTSMRGARLKWDGWWMPAGHGDSRKRALYSFRAARRDCQGRRKGAVGVAIESALHGGKVDGPVVGVGVRPVAAGRAGASQSMPVSPPMGAPGGAPAVGHDLFVVSAGRSRKRLMSAASRVCCACSASFAVGSALQPRGELLKLQERRWRGPGCCGSAGGEPHDAIDQDALFGAAHFGFIRSWRRARRRSPW